MRTLRHRLSTAVVRAISDLLVDPRVDRHAETQRHRLSARDRREKSVPSPSRGHSEASGEPADGAGDYGECLYREGMKAQRVILLVGGVVLVLMGVLWTLQGVGVVGGSVMSGVTVWAVVGPIVALVGVFLLWRASRRAPSKAGSSETPTSSS